MKHSIDIEVDIDFTTDYIGKGVECKVFDVGDNIVYKQFCTTKDMLFAFKCQQHGFMNQIAPEVIGCLEYGYFSVSAISFEELSKTDHSCWYNLREYGYKELLVDKINAVFGIGFADDHSGNIALTDDGDVVLIDFGKFSLRNTLIGQNIMNTLSN